MRKLSIVVLLLFLTVLLVGYWASVNNKWELFHNRTVTVIIIAILMSISTYLISYLRLKNIPSKTKYTNGQKAILVAGYLFFIVVTFIILFGLVFYLIAEYNSSNFQPFELATIVGLLGGFSFTFALSEKCPDNLKPALKRSGALYWFATISFVVFGLFQPLDVMGIKALDPLLTVIIPLSFYLGAIPFAIAVYLSLWNFPKIIGIEHIDTKGFEKMKPWVSLS